MRLPPARIPPVSAFVRAPYYVFCLGATLSAPATTTAPPTRPVSGSSAGTPASTRTPTCAGRGPPAKPPTTRRCAPAPRGTPGTPSSAAAPSRRRTCAPLTPAGRARSAGLGSIDRARTDPCVPVLLGTGGTL